MFGAISMVFPDKGIYITEKLTINYPTVASLFFKNKPVHTDISSIIALSEAEEKVTESFSDTAEIKAIELKDTAVKLNTSIQYKNATKSAMANFFNSMALISAVSLKDSVTFSSASDNAIMLDISVCTGLFLKNKEATVG